MMIFQQSFPMAAHLLGTKTVVALDQHTTTLIDATNGCDRADWCALKYDSRVQGASGCNWTGASK
jgi:hypothetical protein